MHHPLNHIKNVNCEADLKKCWFTMLLPTHPTQALPPPPLKKNIDILRFVFLLFCTNPL